ncbi:MAG: hypothetical protein ACKOQY_04260, partial [Bacteroidota bacterium]
MNKKLHLTTSSVKADFAKPGSVFQTLSVERSSVFIALVTVSLLFTAAFYGSRLGTVTSSVNVGGSPSPSSRFANTGNLIMPANSFYINMGVVPQTLANGLKPYGLLYDLMTNYQVPIYWAIRPNKPTKDTTDYTLSGVVYRTSIFIVPGNYITPDVQAAIASWQAQGVQGTYLATTPTVYVYENLTGFPKVM